MKGGDSLFHELTDLIYWSCAFSPQLAGLSIVVFKMITSRSGPGLGPGPACRRSLPLVIAVYSIFWSSAHATCYNPNGSNRNEGLSPEIYRPCDPGDVHSMCCALNRVNADKCRGDGLCLSGDGPIVWRESCTDPTWESSKCIKLCDSGKGIKRFP